MNDGLRINEIDDLLVSAWNEKNEEVFASLFTEGCYTIVQLIKFMIKQFLSEPLWFKILIITTLLFSITFSSSFFSNNDYFKGFAKLAAAIFFCAYGIKMRRNLGISVIFFILTVTCVYLSIVSLS